AQELASFVDRALDGVEGMLFTTTPREELEEIGRWQLLKDQAFAGQLRAIVAAYNRADRDLREFAGDEVGLAIGTSSTTGGNLVDLAVKVAELPGLLEALSTGMLTERHLRVIVTELHAVALSLEQRQAVVLVLLARFTGQTPGELSKLLTRLILQVDRAAAQARQDSARRDRRVRFYPDVDGQAVLHARGPLAQIAAIQANLQASPAPTTAAGDAPGNAPGDERSRDEREFDLLVDLLTGGAEHKSWQAQVIVPFHTATGGDLELAEVPGFGPILPATARELLHDSHSLLQVAVDEHGQVLAVSDPLPGPATAARQAPEAPQDPMITALKAMTAGPVLHGLRSPRYRPGRRLTRFLEARDHTCVFPGCHRPAATTDKDHRLPWPLGPTDPANLQCLCRHHHRAKHTAFTLTLTTDGDYRWTTRGGWQFPRQRHRY
ncbi:MAG: putative endonuclease, partial [Frankiales bacterium]|nr:putative endonuclease [Frankiales bacterium]